MALEDILAFLKSQPPKEGAKDKPLDSYCGAVSEELAETKVRLAVYRKIIERYAEVVNVGEQKAIPELKSLVNPDDATVRLLKSKFIEELSVAYQGAWNYSSERDFEGYAKKAFALVSALKPVHANLNVTYWLSPADIVEVGAADPLDKAILLASLFVAGGCKDARVRLVSLEGGAKHAVVLCSAGGQVELWDAASGVKLAGKTVDEVLGRYDFGGKKIAKNLYEFNNLDYQDFEET